MFTRCSFNEKGKDVEKLCKKLKESAMEITDYEEKEMIQLTHEENNFYNEQEVCHICKENFCTDESNKNYIDKRMFRDHCHHTGKFIGAAHSKCNLKYKVLKDIPIIIHNTSYDAHFISNQLAKEFKGEFNCVGDNMENISLFLYRSRKNVIMVKQLHTNLNLLIVLDLCQLHYQNLLITHLEFLIV